MIYLIDGYNAAHWLDQDEDRTPEELRSNLLATLARHRPRDAEEIHVFWDMRRPNPSVPALESKGWYTAHNVPDADAAIIDTVYDSNRPAHLTVVSRDREVAGRSRQLGARVTTPRDLLGGA